MGWLGIALLAVAWLAILAPALRPQRRATPHFTVHSFRRSMGILAGNRAALGATRARHRADGRFLLVPADAERIALTGARGRRRAAAAGRRPSAAGRPPRRPHRPARPSRPTRRRLAVVRALIAAVAVSAVAWVGVGAVGAWPLIASVGALLGYCALLAGSAPQRARGRRPAPQRRPRRQAASRVPRQPDAPREILLDDERVAHGA